MSFAAAAGLWLGLLAIPVVGLYILKIKRPRQVVPYLRLWEQLAAERQFTTLFQRLQRWLSLALQLLILAALVLAYSGATLSESHTKEESVVLVLDTSASMQARHGGRTRLELALERARELVEGRSAEDEFAVLAAGARPEVLQGFARSTLRLREALAAVRPSPASGDLRAAHRIASDLLQGRRHPRILLLGDAAAGVAPELAAADDRVRWLPVGSDAPNLGILRLQARRNHAVGTDYVLAVVRNFGDQPATANLLLQVGNNLVKVRPLELAPQAEWSETFELTLPEGGFLRAELEHPALPDGKPGSDALALDDVAHAALAPLKRYRILVVTGVEHGEVPFRAAFTALESMVEPTASRIASAAEWDGLAAQAASDFDLVLFVRWAPPELPPAGRFLCIDALPGGLPARALPPVPGAVVRDADREHPLNRFLELRDLQLPSARPLDLDGGEPFLAIGAGPVGVLFDGRARRVVYYGIDVLADLFFLQVAFPILVRNVLGWLHERETEAFEATYRPGDVIRPRFPLPGDAVEVGWRHDGADAPGLLRVPLHAGRFAFADTLQRGRYWVRAGDADHRTTVNLFDPGESDLALPDDLPAPDPDVERGGFLFGRDLWPLLLLGAALLWILEWGLYHRRFTE
jgi:hypothetical protein